MSDLCNSEETEGNGGRIHPCDQQLVAEDDRTHPRQGTKITQHSLEKKAYHSFSFYSGSCGHLSHVAVIFFPRISSAAIACASSLHAVSLSALLYLTIDFVKDQLSVFSMQLAL